MQITIIRTREQLEKRKQPLLCFFWDFPKDPMKETNKRDWGVREMRPRELRAGHRYLITYERSNNIVDRIVDLTLLGIPNATKEEAMAKLNEPEFEKVRVYGKTYQESLL